jgi:hypothetical protein
MSCRLLKLPQVSCLIAESSIQIEGAATIVSAGIGFYFLPNFPNTTKWLNDEERWLASARLAADDIGSAKGHGATEGHWASLKQCLGDWRTWVSRGSFRVFFFFSLKETAFHLLLHHVLDSPL